ncbi:MAG: glycosyltransferase family 2 protein [Anaerolineae bacterium]|jgi:hypothetical protein|nr:glycosyltransferase family 2 protein [Anaerolineae bacterium]
MTSLKAVILTYNEAQHIGPCIESVRWTDGVVVLDSFSSDHTVDLARAAGAEVLQRPWENYAHNRNIALAEVKADWVLFVDADERATPELAAEARHTIASCTETGWWIPRYNFIFGHRMRATGWYPDHQMRLLRRGSAHYDPSRGVHELVILEGAAGYLTSHLIHLNYRTLAQFLAKQGRYLTYDVGVLLEAGADPKPHTPYTQAVRHAWWRFFALQGWRDTVWGLFLSATMGYYEMLKYRGVRRERQKARRIALSPKNPGGSA